MYKRILLFVFCIFFYSSAPSQNLRIAISSNLQSIMEKIKKDFKIKSGIDIETISGASVNLANQIRNGAPYDLFLSADKKSPEDLYQEGLTYNIPQVYALGNLIICSTRLKNINNWSHLVLSDSVKKIAMANPNIAPYGKAALETLNHSFLLDKIKEKIVQGESISQVNTYIVTGSVSIGFTAQSLIVDFPSDKPLYWQKIDPRAYEPLEQAMVILKNAKGDRLNQAKEFFTYMLSNNTKTLFKKYGYSIP